MNPNNLTFEEATSEAAHDSIMANELDILVSKTREINRKRDRNLKRMQSLLQDIEARVEQLT